MQSSLNDELDTTGDSCNEQSATRPDNKLRIKIAGSETNINYINASLMMAMINLFSNADE